MPLPGAPYTSEDYWNLPEGRRAELIAGKLYDMAPLDGLFHQERSVLRVRCPGIWDR